MPTPLGHSLAGFAVYGFSARAQEHDRLDLLFLSVVLANAPDLDFIPGLLIGKPSLYHQGITHSLGFAVLVSLGITWIYRLRGKPTSALFPLCFFSCASHLVLDCLGPDGKAPFGLPLLWPISNEYFLSPVSVFLGVRHDDSASVSALEWIKSLFDLHNLAAIVVETLLIAPFVFLSQKLRSESRDEWSVSGGHV